MDRGPYRATTRWPLQQSDMPGGRMSVVYQALTISGCTLAAIILVGLIFVAIWFFWLRGLIKERQQSSHMRRQRLIVQQRVPVTSAPAPERNHIAVPVEQQPTPIDQSQQRDELQSSSAFVPLYLPREDFVTVHQQHRPVSLMPINQYETSSYNNMADSSFANESSIASTQNSYLHSDTEGSYPKPHTTPYVPRYIKRVQQMSAV